MVLRIEPQRGKAFDRGPHVVLVRLERHIAERLDKVGDHVLIPGHLGIDELKLADQRSPNSSPEPVAIRVVCRLYVSRLFCRLICDCSNVARSV